MASIYSLPASDFTPHIKPTSSRKFHLGLNKQSSFRLSRTASHECYDKAPPFLRYIIMALLPDPLPIHPVPEDRDVIIDWARKLLNTKDFVILDTETTGLGHADEVVQVGIIDADGRELIDSLVKPEKARRMPRRAQDVHGISMKMLANAPTFFELHPQIIEAVAGRVVLCYNAAFDMRVMVQTARKYDLEERGCQLDLRSDCVMIAYSQFIGEYRKYSHGYAWQKLPRLSQQNHKAVEDCQLTLDLMREVAAVPRQSELLKISVGIYDFAESQGVCRGA
jgi:DNA polymerase III subunit epsilon